MFEEDDVEDQDVLVKILVTVGDEVHFHQFLDVAPHFDTAWALLEPYQEIEDADIRVWHMDPPQSEPIVPNHEGTMVAQ